MVVQQSLGLAERLRAFGPGRDIEVQDAMARVTLDVILTTGFDLPSNAVDLDAPCPLLEDMHFLMAETFRCVDALICWSPTTATRLLRISMCIGDGCYRWHACRKVSTGATNALYPCKDGMSDMQWLQCRGFTNPFRKLSRKLAPNSALAKEFSSRLANLHSIWHQIMTDVLASAPICAPTCSHFSSAGSMVPLCAPVLNIM